MAAETFQLNPMWVSGFARAFWSARERAGPHQTLRCSVICQGGMNRRDQRVASDGLREHRNLEPLCPFLVLPACRQPAHHHQRRFDVSLAQFVDELKTVAISLSKIANDIRWLASSARS